MKTYEINKNILARYKSNTEFENNACGGRFYAAKADEDREILSFMDSLPDEPTSEDLEQEIDRWYNNEASKDFENVLWKYICKCARHFANWQKEQLLLNNEKYHTVPVSILDRLYANEEKLEQMMKEAIDGEITFDYYGNGDMTYGCVAHGSFCLEDRGLKDKDTVKLIIVKEG